MSGKTVQNVILSKHCQWNREIKTRYSKGCCAFSMHKIHPMQGWKLTWAGLPAMQLYTLAAHRIALGNKATVYCNARQCTNYVPSFEKVDFRKLQNGSDIRGVAVAGVEGEPVNLTEPVAEAIAAAFTAWLLEKKNHVGSKRLRVSIGHDSRISAQRLQDAVSRGLAAAGVEVVQYGLASTPAMFNSTLTEDEEYLCPADGSIMITGTPEIGESKNLMSFVTTKLL